MRVVVLFALAASLCAPTAAALAAAPGRHRPPHRSKVKPRPQPVELVSLNTHESFRLRPDLKGRLGARELRGFNRFLRCHHTGRQHSMSQRLASLLYATGVHFDFRKLVVVAGYRAPKIARMKGNPKSPHKKGLACDFRVEGVDNTVLRDYVRGAFKRVGVGYYPNSGFVHLDVRAKQSAFWIDYSAPGQRAVYSRTPSEDLKNEAELSVQDPLDLQGPPGVSAPVDGGAGSIVPSGLPRPPPPTP